MTVPSTRAHTLSHSPHDAAALPPSQTQENGRLVGDCSVNVGERERENTQGPPCPARLTCVLCRLLRVTAAISRPCPSSRTGCARIDTHRVAVANDGILQVAGPDVDSLGHIPLGARSWCWHLNFERSFWAGSGTRDCGSAQKREEMSGGMCEQPGGGLTLSSPPWLTLSNPPPGTPRPHPTPHGSALWAVRSAGCRHCAPRAPVPGQPAGAPPPPVAQPS